MTEREKKKEKRKSCDHRCSLTWMNQTNFLYRLVPRSDDIPEWRFLFLVLYLWKRLFCGPQASHTQHPHCPGWLGGPSRNDGSERAAETPGASLLLVAISTFLWGTGQFAVRRISTILPSAELTHFGPRLTSPFFQKIKCCASDNGRNITGMCLKNKSWFKRLKINGRQTPSHILFIFWIDQDVDFAQGNVIVTMIYKLLMESLACYKTLKKVKKCLKNITYQFSIFC